MTRKYFGFIITVIREEFINTSFNTADKKLFSVFRLEVIELVEYFSLDSNQRKII
jgi:hypothetical protein